jgi:ADP-heptose:LPS heptosyltransferase
MKILIVQIGRLGDMILTTPLFRTIKEKIPNSTIHVLASQTNHRILITNKFVDKIFIFKRDPINTLKLYFTFFKERYDYLLDPKDHRSSGSELLARLSRAKIKIGFNHDKSTVYDYGIPSDISNFELHAVQRNLNVLKPLGIDISAIIHPDIFIEKDSIEYVDNWLSQFKKKKIILINISVNVQERFWPVEHWREVINNFNNEDHQFVITYLDTDLKAAKLIAKDFANVSIFHDRNLQDLSAIVKRADLMISPDTSLIHFASAFNIPTIALFQNVDWNYNKFRPLSDLSITLMPEKEQPVEKIKPQKVIESVNSLLVQMSRLNQNIL